MTTYLLNSPVLTDFGTYQYEEISSQSTIKILSAGFVSAIRHPSTAQVLTTLLGIEVPCKDITINQRVGDQALVFALDRRPPFGKELTIELLGEYGYKLGLLTRTE